MTLPWSNKPVGGNSGEFVEAVPRAETCPMTANRLLRGNPRSLQESTGKIRIISGVFLQDPAAGIFNLGINPVKIYYSYRL
jgi:hypothetical protein